MFKYFTIITIVINKVIILFSTNLKEMLARFASGKIEDLPEQVITPEIDKIVQGIYKAKQELSKSNVLSTAHKMYPEYINPIVSDEINDADLLFVVENEHIKNRLIEFDLKLTDALTRQKDNPLFDWYELADNITSVLKPKNTKGFVFLDEISFDTERAVASWGFPQLDAWLEGGITESSLTIFYAASNTGKSTFVTVDLTAKLLAQGKIPLIVALEGSPSKFATKIAASLLGLAHLDPKEYTEQNKQDIIRFSRTLPHIPIINKGCKKRWEIEKYIQQYKADVVIFDQITIAGNGRDWEGMSKSCEILKQISISSGVPVIALTQSSEKNYNGKSDVAEDDLKTNSYIKYSESLFQDATHVVEITKHDNSSMRGLTIRKTKDDNTTRLGPVRLLVELTPKGYVERYWRNTEGVRFELNQDGKLPITNTPRILARKPIEIEEPIKITPIKIDPEIAEIKMKKADANYMRTETGTLPIMIQDGGLFSDEAWRSTPDRLEAAGLAKIADTFRANLNNMPEYGETENPAFCLRITSKEIPTAFRNFYD
jgi:replicative DNA helicase